MPNASASALQAGLKREISQLQALNIHIIAFIWGLCEATFFFIVPDVWLSLIAKDNLKLASKAAIFCLIGALLGGALMYYLGLNHFENTRKFLSAVPAINPALIMQAHQSLQDQGALAIIIGGFKGMPYKLYASLSANSGIGFFTLATTTIFARLLRFFTVILIVRFLANLFVRLGYQGNLTKPVLSVWIIFYSFYFWKFSA